MVWVYDLTAVANSSANDNQAVQESRQETSTRRTG